MSDNPSSRMSGSGLPQNANSEGLPKNYGDTKIVILPRDPFWFYAYWEVSQSSVSGLRKIISEEKLNSSSWMLRVYDITDIDFDGKNAHKYFDIHLNSITDNWYVNVPEANRAWCVDLGINTPDGQFIVLARSNALIMPRHGVSSITDEQWGILQHEFDRLLKLSGLDKLGKSSMDITRLMRERWEEIISLSLPSSHLGASSWKSVPQGLDDKNFWLKADAEVVVYGATESDAKLRVQGKDVNLKPDGSFSLRFKLSEGHAEYPIEAQSGDGDTEKKITFNVKRETK